MIVFRVIIEANSYNSKGFFLGGGPPWQKKMDRDQSKCRVGSIRIQSRCSQCNVVFSATSVLGKDYYSWGSGPEPEFLCKTCRWRQNSVKIKWVETRFLKK